jgi:hypothetical protein
MIKKYLTRAISILIILFFFVGCVSSTTMRVNVIELNGRPVFDANVLVDGEHIGVTPNASIDVSNFILSEYELIVAKEGYYTVRKNATKEVKPANVVLGVIFWFPFLWVYGPKAQQSVVLTPEI